jgi:hypothetical protein
VEKAVCPLAVWENVCVNDWVIVQPPPIMLSLSVSLVLHHREKEYEHVIFVVCIGVCLYDHIVVEYGYSMNVFEKSELYGYGVVLFNVVISKHIDEKRKQAPQAPHSHMVTYENNSN